MRLINGCLVAAMSLLVSSSIFAVNYTIPSANNALIGEVQFDTLEKPNYVVAIQKQYNVGYNAIAEANPHLDLTKDFPEGTTIVIPTQHLLPNQPHEGIVINLPEMRMYYYMPNSDQVITFPIGIGKIGNTTPIINTSIIRKTENPSWTPPADIREFNLKQGIILPKVMAPGPENPLGPYAIYMKLPTYLIHSTIFPESIGKRASFGCIRMYESDIKVFFPTVQKDMPVAIINVPVKTGWQDDQLYMEAHNPLQEHQLTYENSLAGMVHSVNLATKDEPVLIDWQLIAFLAKERDGLPHEVGMKIKTGQ